MFWGAIFEGDLGNLKFWIWEHPGTQKQTSQALGRGFILVWVFPVPIVQKILELGRGRRIANRARTWPHPDLAQNAKIGF